MNKTCRLVFELLQASLFSDKEDVVDLIEYCNWNDVYEEMKEQKVEALAYTWLNTHRIPDESVHNQWMEQSILQISHGVQVMWAQQNLLELLENNNVACVIIKGSAAAMAYPSPIMRVLGDVDILVKRKDYEAAATILESCGYQLIGEKELSHHHLVYVKDGVIFELHRRLATILESNTELIELFEEGINNREIREYQGFSFPVLPNDFNGLVLLYHIYQHLRSGLGLRQIVDWVMYLQENDGMEQLLPILRRTNMEQFAKTVTIGCQKYFRLKTFVVDTGDYPYEEFFEYVMKMGNFGRKKNAEEGEIIRFFRNTGNVRDAFERIQRGGKSRWELAAKYKFFRPFAWLYQLFHIIRQILDHHLTPYRIAVLRKKGSEEHELLVKLGVRQDGKIEISEKEIIGQLNNEKEN